MTQLIIGLVILFIVLTWYFILRVIHHAPTKERNHKEEE